jgi:hypothetical protein
VRHRLGGGEMDPTRIAHGEIVSGRTAPPRSVRLLPRPYLPQPLAPRVLPIASAPARLPTAPMKPLRSLLADSLPSHCRAADAAPPPAMTALDRDCPDFDNQMQAQNYFLDCRGRSSDPTGSTRTETASRVSPCLALTSPCGGARSPSCR